MTRRAWGAGFSLVEVVLAIAVLSTGLLALSAMIGVLLERRAELPEPFALAVVCQATDQWLEQARRRDFSGHAAAFSSGQAVSLFHYKWAVPEGGADWRCRDRVGFEEDRVAAAQGQGGFASTIHRVRLSLDPAARPESAPEDVFLSLRAEVALVAQEAEPAPTGNETEASTISTFFLVLRP